MPRYRNESGVVVNVSEEMARLVGGLTPIDQPITTPPDSPDSLGVWLAAEQAYRADVEAWLAAESDAAALLAAENAARKADSSQKR